MRFAIAATHPTCQIQAETLAAQLNLPLTTLVDPQAQWLLCVTPQHLELRQTENKSPGPLRVDFLTSRFLQRIKQFNRHELLVRAVGLPPQATIWRILDTTAGLGQDGLLLAFAGCQVTLLERSPIIAALLQDGLQRAQCDNRFANLSIRLLTMDAIVYLSTLAAADFPEVIYLDPMYPLHSKKSLANKNQNYLRALAGDDEDAAELFALALTRAQKRVVVKRADHAPFINQQPPDWQLHGKTVRFDIYLPQGVLK